MGHEEIEGLKRTQIERLAATLSKEEVLKRMKEFSTERSRSLQCSNGRVEVYSQDRLGLNIKSTSFLEEEFTYAFAAAAFCVARAVTSLWREPHLEPAPELFDASWPCLGFR